MVLGLVSAENWPRPGVDPDGALTHLSASSAPSDAAPGVLFQNARFALMYALFPTSTSSTLASPLCSDRCRRPGTAVAGQPGGAADGRAREAALRAETALAGAPQSPHDLRVGGVRRTRRPAAAEVTTGQRQFRGRPLARADLLDRLLQHEARQVRPV